jgi:tetratricopeptide (TPR) repeat protein
MGIGQDTALSLWFPWIASILGAVYTLGGRIADAVPLLTQAIAQTAAMEMSVMQVLCHLSLGEAQMLSGRREEAQARAEQALTLARARPERGHQAYTLRLLGDMAAQREPPDVTQAEAYYRQALALADELGMRPLQAHCHRCLGTLYTQVSRPEQARVELSVAIELYRAMEMTFWLKRAETALAQIT